MYLYLYLLYSYSTPRLYSYYKQYVCIDGGFFQDPHPSHVKPDLIIYPEMFDNENKNIDNFSNNM